MLVWLHYVLFWGGGMSELVDINSTEFKAAVRAEASDVITGVLDHALKDAPPGAAMAVMLHAHICRFEQFRGETGQQFDELKGDVSDLKGDVKELKVDVSDLKEDVQELKVDVSGLKEDVQELKVDVSALKEDVKELKVDVRGLKVQFGALEENMNQQFMNVVKLIKEGQKSV